MLMSAALFRQGQYSDIVDWIWSLGDISSGGECPPHASAHCQFCKFAEIGLGCIDWGATLFSNVIISALDQLSLC